MALSFKQCERKTVEEDDNESMVCCYGYLCFLYSLLPRILGRSYLGRYPFHQEVLVASEREWRKW